MKKWDYQIITGTYWPNNEKHRLEMFKSMGQEGWELTGILFDHGAVSYYFKKELPTTSVQHINYNEYLGQIDNPNEQHKNLNTGTRL